MVLKQAQQLLKQRHWHLALKKATQARNLGARESAIIVQTIASCGMRNIGQANRYKRELRRRKSVKRIEARCNSYGVHTVPVRPRTP